MPNIVSLRSPRHAVECQAGERVARRLRKHVNMAVRLNCRGVTDAALGLRCLLAAGLALAGCRPSIHRESSKSTAEFLRWKVHPVRSIDPSDQDFRDLQALKSSLHGVRLVLLGEATHGDGATFLAKTRIVEFLHEELGFDVLIFESGFYDCARASQELTRGAAFDTVFRQCVWSMWAERQQVQPLISYLERSRHTARPIALAGLDPGFLLAPSSSFFAQDLRAFVVRTRALLAQPEAELQSFLSFTDKLYGYTTRQGTPPSSADVEAFAVTATRLAGLVAQDGTLAQHDREYWARVLENLASHARFRLLSRGVPPIAAVEQRDAHMARNALSLLRHQFAGRKAIIWSASLHAARNLSAIHVDNDQPSPFGITLQEMYRTKKVMGDYLWSELGRSMYSMMFTASQGQYAGGAQPTQLEPPPPGSLEAFLQQTGFEQAIVDLRRPAVRADSLRAPFTSRPLGYSAMTATWETVVDGFFLIRSMTPSTRVASGSDPALKHP